MKSLSIKLRAERIPAESLITDATGKKVAPTVEATLTDSAKGRRDFQFSIFNSSLRTPVGAQFAIQLNHGPALFWPDDTADPDRLREIAEESLTTEAAEKEKRV